MLSAETPKSDLHRSMDPRVVGYPSRLNLYNIPPPYELKIEQFEQFALDRLSILKSIETAGIRNSLKQKDKSYNANILKLIKDNIPLSRNSLLKTQNPEARRRVRKQQFEERKKDHISHFILRLAFCQNSDLRSWFSKLETELFRIRISDEDNESLDHLIDQADFGGEIVQLATFKPIKLEDKKDYTELLVDLQKLYGLPDKELMQQSFFKVPFEIVLDQIRQRTIIVKNGFAYVPRKLQTVLLVNMFKDRLESSLEVLAKALPGIEEDDQVTPILASLAKQHLTTTSNSYAGDESGKFTHQDIDGLAKAHFAPCMKNLHSNLRQNAHLKHFGRLQYGLFLKAIGLPYEESLTFWRKAFSRMSDDQFQKGGHTYNIRHSYGLEGKRTSYTSYSCMKIITSNHPGAGDHHGCPFKHFSPENVKTMMTDYIVGATGSAPSSNAVQAGVQEIVNIMKAGHFQVACTRLFEITHPAMGKESVEMIEHPNQYFELSLHGVGKKANSGDVVMDETIDDAATNTTSR